MSTKNWPDISYFHEGRKFEKEVKSDLEIIERKNWKILCRAKSDGSYWILDETDKYQTRFLVRLPCPENWSEFDTVELEKNLLLESRGGLSGDNCLWKQCGQKALIGSAYCLDHTYEAGTRE